MKGTAEVAHGPMFIGFFVNVLLYGIMITQLYIYFSSYKKDRIWIKLFVILLLCDTVNTVFDVVYPYGSLIVHFGALSKSRQWWQPTKSCLKPMWNIWIMQTGSLQHASTLTCFTT
uniref:Uncharacterized protein n=1 Tax=Moniliophthora roreri TaxID=221103 RepID=A0A0W0FUW8_MONRR